jgi:hypothetical protein
MMETQKPLGLSVSKPAHPERATPFDKLRANGILGL